MSSSKTELLKPVAVVALLLTEGVLLCHKYSLCGQDANTMNAVWIWEPALACMSNFDSGCARAASASASTSIGCPHAAPRWMPTGHSLCVCIHFFWLPACSSEVDADAEKSMQYR